MVDTREFLKFHTDQKKLVRARYKDRGCSIGCVCLIQERGKNVMRFCYVVNKSRTLSKQYNKKNKLPRYGCEAAMGATLAGQIDPALEGKAA